MLFGGNVRAGAWSQFKPETEMTKEDTAESNRLLKCVFDKDGKESASDTSRYM